MRKVFLDDLPRKNVNRHGSVIDWELSVGKTVSFEYDSIVGDIKIISYDKKRRYIQVMYNGKIKEIQVNNFANKAAIGRIIGIGDNTFRFDIGHTFKDDKRDFTIVKRSYQHWSPRKQKSMTKIYSCLCNKCKYEWEVDEYHLVEGNGCPVCASKIIIAGINDLGTIYPFVKKYFSNEEYKSISPRSGKKVEVTCPDCGRKKKIIVSNLVKRKSIGCTCQDNFTYPNKFIFSFIL